MTSTTTIFSSSGDDLERVERKWWSETGEPGNLHPTPLKIVISNHAYDATGRVLSTKGDFDYDEQASAVRQAEEVVEYNARGDITKAKRLVSRGVFPEPDLWTEIEYEYDAARLGLSRHSNAIRGRARSERGDLLQVRPYW